METLKVRFYDLKKLVYREMLVIGSILLINDLSDALTDGTVLNEADFISRINGNKGASFVVLGNKNLNEIEVM